MSNADTIAANYLWVHPLQGFVDTPLYPHLQVHCKSVCMHVNWLEAFKPVAVDTLYCWTAMTTYPRFESNVWEYRIVSRKPYHCKYEYHAHMHKICITNKSPPKPSPNSWLLGGGVVHHHYNPQFGCRHVAKKAWNNNAWNSMKWMSNSMLWNHVSTGVATTSVMTTRGSTQVQLEGNFIWGCQIIL